MRLRHPAGCACDQPWHHPQPHAEAHAARHAERERMSTARRIGKAIAINARRHGAPIADLPSTADPPPPG